MDHVEPDAALAAAFLNLSDAGDESAVSLVPTNSHLQNKPVRPKPTGALSSSTDQEQNPSRLLGPTNSTQPAETHSSKKMADSKKRKKPPTKRGGNPKQLKKTNTDKKGRSEPIEINSDDESLSDESSDALNDLLDELSDEPENSDDEEQKTDDEKHLPRPPKKTTDGELKVTGSKKITHPTDEEESVPLDLPVPKSTKAQTKKRKKLSEAVPEPFPANAVNVQQIPTGFMQPYPSRPTLPTAPITKVITAEEWDRRNAHWLDQLMDPESTKEMFGPTIEEEVIEEIFPLISKARRNVLNRWAKSEDFNLDSRLLEAPILPQVEVEDDTSQEILNVETDTARRSIRAIETAALSLPKAHQKTAALIKQHTDRLFACRDHEIDNYTLMAQSVAKLRESSSVNAATLNAAFETNETRLRSRVDPAQTAREEGLEALEADMQNALKTPTVDGSADQLVLFLKSHWRMRDDEISDWKDMANSVCHTAKEAGHPINQTDQEACNNHDWDSLLRLAITRGGKALVALLNMERCAPDEAFLGRRNEWYKDVLTDEEYDRWSDTFPIDEEPQSGGEQP
ncbi:hypothetical protein FOC4_g10002726 [Fusarium odoratissimum]|uniref:Uncharacterized protein n=3 Tax=Fusarium oxysporum species complex TaxID=171631 RepID=N1SBX3_FUSC4|nr:uncharacterized protein FOIG_14631 [Fusarium odoratissimum NRRL 54006]EMT74245.1 hypothetical protein FOC4_g10002726 [Fusarium odoratissimum]EXL92187.1 hypothetical protein FOIG_14631 [Fusarium odoratissimum NRRL 54006]